MLSILLDPILPVFAIMFIGFFAGMFTVGVWVLMRRWFPDRSWMAGLMLAGLGGLLARPSGFIDPDNNDFVILSPVWLAVLFAAGLILLYGVSFAVLADRWATSWPRLEFTPVGLAAAVPMAAVFGLSVMVVVPALIMAAVICYAAWVRPIPERAERWLTNCERPGRWILAIAATLGAAWTSISAVQTLTL